MKSFFNTALKTVAQVAVVAAGVAIGTVVAAMALNKD